MATTMTIRRTSGGHAELPQEEFVVGIPERATWPDRNLHPEFTVDQVPGGVRTNRGGVSGIIVALDVEERYIAEEGMSFGLGADEGYVWTATVRPATDQEAAPILAEEQAEERQRTLNLRMRKAFSWRAGNGTDAVYEQPLSGPTPASAVPVPQAPRYGYDGEPAAELLVDREEGLAWTLAYNGADGDDHSRSNWGSWIAIAHPLTKERAGIIEELTRVYASDDAWRRMGVSAEAQQVLIEAGWTLPALQRVESMRVIDTADARVLVEHPQSYWTERGWTWVLPYPHSMLQDRWKAGEALELAQGGLTYRQAQDRRDQGYTTVQEALNATAPTAPEDATRIQLAPNAPDETSQVERMFSIGAGGRIERPVWFDSAAALADYLAPREDHWGRGVYAETGPRVRHVGKFGGGDWVLWDDGNLTFGWWRGSARAAGLSPAAEKALTLLIEAGRAGESERWLHMLEATDYTRTEHYRPKPPRGDHQVAFDPGLEEYLFTCDPWGRVEHWWVASTRSWAPDGDELPRLIELCTSLEEAERALDQQLSELIERYGD